MDLLCQTRKFNTFGEMSELRKNIYSTALASATSRRPTILSTCGEEIRLPRKRTLVHEFAKVGVLRGVKEKHPKAERAGQFGKFLLLLGGRLVSQSANTLGRESRVEQSACLKAAQTPP